MEEQMEIEKKNNYQRHSKTTMNRIIIRIKSLMEEKSISQRELGEHIGIKSSTLSQKLSGEHAFTIPELIDVANYLDVPIERLLGDQYLDNDNNHYTYSGLLSILVDLYEMNVIKIHRTRDHAEIIIKEDVLTFIVQKLFEHINGSDVQQKIKDSNWYKKYKKAFWYDLLKADEMEKFRANKEKYKPYSTDRADYYSEALRMTKMGE